MSRVLWLGDAGCNTGFGVATHGIGDRLVSQYGHDVHVLANNYRGDYFPTPMKLYRPDLVKTGDVYGQSRIIELIGKIEPEVIIALNDPYILLRLLFRNKFDPDLVLARYAPFLAYMPVDGTNFPHDWGRMPELVSGIEPLPSRPAPSMIPVVMSRHGHTLFPNAPLIPHGIDSQTFRPLTIFDPIQASSGDFIASKADAKRLLQLPEDSILILRVDRNSFRKNFADTWKAVAPVMHEDPRVHVWFHCKIEGDDVELAQVVSRDMSIADRFHWPADLNTWNGWTLQDLVAVYNAADIFVSTSMGEGFGLTLGEAAACGIPIVAQNVSSIPEVVGPGGILLEPERLYTPHSGEDQWLPDVTAFTDAIRTLVNDEGARRELGEAGRKHVVESFTWDDAARRFHELITAVGEKNSRSPITDAGGAQ